MGLTEGCVYVNGTFVPPAQATVPAFDHGYLFGDGLFETLRTYGGVPFRLDEHLARLKEGLAELAIRGAPPARELRATVLETLGRARLPEAYLRITITRGVSSRGLDPTGCDTPTVLIAALPLRTYPPAHYAEGIAADVLWARPTQVHPPPRSSRPAISTRWWRAWSSAAEPSRRGSSSTNQATSPRGPSPTSSLS